MSDKDDAEEEWKDQFAALQSGIDQTSAGLGEVAKLLASYRDFLLHFGFSYEQTFQIILEYHNILMNSSLEKRDEL